MDKNNEVQDVLSEEQAVITVKCKGYSQIIFNRPEKLNTISEDFIISFLTCLKESEEDKDVKFIILKGSGRAFCAGGDVKDILRVVCGREKQYFEDIVITYHEILYYMGCVMKTPIISFMDGITFGGGIGFSQLTPFKIATENTVFCFPEASIGHFCDAMASFIIPRMEGYLGVYLTLTGHPFRAEDTVFAGFASHFMVSANMDNLEKELSEQEEVTLESINEIIQKFSAPANHSPKSYTLHGDKLLFIERCFKYDSVEEIITALEKEDSKFAKSCLTSIRSKSPTSLKISMELLRRGATSSFITCLEYEYRIWISLPYSHDYREGVNSFLEKRKPQWFPSTLNQANAESIYFDNSLWQRLPYVDLKYDFMQRPYQMYTLPTVEEVIATQQKYGLKTNGGVIA